MNRFVMSAAALTILAACTQDKQAVESSQSPSDPTGTVVGVVTSSRTGLPLAGVTVTAPSAGGLRSATTAANGAYSLGGLVAGATYEVRFAAAGHVTALGFASIPNAAGDYPTNGVAQLDVALAQANATVSGHVFARDGLPAQGVVLMVDLRSRGFDLVATATTDAQGAYSLTGLPGAPTGLSVGVVAQPWDADADGFADYDALSRSAVTYPAAPSLLDFDLRLAAADLLLLTSNVESGTMAPTDPIRLSFNRELDLGLTHVTLYDSTASRYVAVTTSADSTSRILTVVPSGGTALAVLHSYTLTAYGVATTGATLTATRSFQTDVAVALLPAVTGLIVNPASADFDTATFNLTWDLSAAASGYQVWVRDTSRNPSWLLTNTVPNSFTPSATVTLPATFDYYQFDGIRTPFAFDAAVDFAVVAVNAAGEAPLPSTAVPVQRTDTVAPVVDGAVQGGGTADNTGGGTARTITLTLTFSEYMDRSVTPTIALPVAGETATFAWNALGTVGVFTITIPASTDGRGRYTVTGGLDTSGNAMTAGTGMLSGSVQLVTNGGFEAGALTGWTPGFTGTATAPVATSAVAATGAWSAQLGNASGMAQSGNSTLYQTVTLPVGFSSIVASASYRPYSNYPYPGWDTSSCIVQNSTGTATLATIFTTYANSLSFATASVNLTSLGGQTVRVTCQTSQKGLDVTGMYLDDVSILATP